MSLLADLTTMHLLILGEFLSTDIDKIILMVYVEVSLIVGELVFPLADRLRGHVESFGEFALRESMLDTELSDILSY